MRVASDASARWMSLSPSRPSRPSPAALALRTPDHELCVRGLLSPECTDEVRGKR